MRCDYEVLFADTGEVLARGRADEFLHGLSASGVGDGAHGFWVTFPRPLSEDQRRRVIVRTLDRDGVAVASTSMGIRYEPVLHVAMDIVDNCNLRCPFCLYDYANTHTTHFMTEATLEAALRFLPYTRDGQFWFSCLHEPTLHPQIMPFIDKVPRAYARKGFYTSNLAKRMPQVFFDWLARAPVDHINISIESLDPTLYERLRKGARHRIFVENWQRLLASFDASEAPPRLHYIAMAYKSNLRELPNLVDHLVAQARAEQVEVRYTFPVGHIDPAFAIGEYLDAGDWAWLSKQVAHHPPSRVVIAPPPAPTPDDAIAELAASGRPPETVLKGRYMFRLSWDGMLSVIGVLARSRYHNAGERTILTTNIRDVGDPEDFLLSLAALA